MRILKIQSWQRKLALSPRAKVSDVKLALRRHRQRRKNMMSTRHRQEARSEEGEDKVKEHKDEEQEAMIAPSTWARRQSRLTQP